MAVSAYAHADSQEHPIAQINITPLVDVMLVLLVIFMIAAPVLTAPLPLRLPQAGPDAPPPPRAVLRVTSAGEFELRGQTVQSDALPAALFALRAEAPNTVLEIAASEDSDYQGFATALAAARTSGLNNVSLSR